MKNKKNFILAFKSRGFSIGLVFVWMGLIFILSHQEAGTSSALSSGLTKFIADLVSTLTGAKNLDFSIFHFLARKSAHFLAYLILGVLIYRAMPFASVKLGLASLSLSVLYAMSDEFHQTFVPGRSGEARDVLIDGLGALNGVILYYIFKTYQRKKLKNTRTTS